MGLLEGEFGINWEQMEKAVEDVVRLVRAYYEELLTQGFTEEQALILAESFQASLWSVNR